MTSTELMKSIIQRIATGPELSKDLDFDETKAGMQAILRGEIDDVQSAIFFIALRMKRETEEENKGVLAAILAESDKHKLMSMIWLIWVIRTVVTIALFRFHHSCRWFWPSWACRV